MHDEAIVDFKAFLDHGPALDGPAPIGNELDLMDPYGESLCKCDHCEGNPRLNDNQKTYFDNVKDPRNLGRLQLMMLPPRVLGYWLARKRWVELDVNKVVHDNRGPDNSSYKQLQLSPAKKELIKTLITNHARNNGPQRKMNDLNPDKGNGLVILLHGKGTRSSQIFLNVHD